MKNLIRGCVIMFLAFQLPAYAQDIHLSADSVTKLLCKKWEVDYGITAGEKIDLPPEVGHVYFEFFKDGTFSATGGKPKVSFYGKWVYNSGKGMISITVPGKPPQKIIALTKDQFVVYADDDNERYPNDAMKTKIYFKVRSDQ